jgi:hypothetical protein
MMMMMMMSAFVSSSGGVFVEGESIWNDEATD